MASALGVAGSLCAECEQGEDKDGSDITAVLPACFTMQALSGSASL